MVKTPAEQLARRERLAAQSRARTEAANARQTTVDRKRDTRRKVIIGSMMVDAAQKDPVWRDLLETLMRRVDREQDRRAFEDWALTIDDGAEVGPEPANAPRLSVGVASDTRVKTRWSALSHAPFRWDDD